MRATEMRVLPLESRDRADSIGGTLISVALPEPFLHFTPPPTIEMPF